MNLRIAVLTSVVGLELDEGCADGDELRTFVGGALGMLDGRLLDGFCDVVGCADANDVGTMDGSELGN